MQGARAAGSGVRDRRTIRSSGTSGTIPTGRNDKRAAIGTILTHLGSPPPAAAPGTGGARRATRSRRAVPCAWRLLTLPGIIRALKFLSAPGTPPVSRPLDRGTASCRADRSVTCFGGIRYLPPARKGTSRAGMVISTSSSRSGTGTMPDVRGGGCRRRSTLAASTASKRVSDVLSSPDQQALSTPILRRSSPARATPVSGIDAGRRLLQAAWGPSVVAPGGSWKTGGGDVSWEQGCPRCTASRSACQESAACPSDLQEVSCTPRDLDRTTWRGTRPSRRAR